MRGSETAQALAAEHAIRQHMLKAFLICPVRGIDEEYERGILAQVEYLEKIYRVYWPKRDTDQSASSLEICRQNRAAIRDADVVYVIYNGKSEGCLFDLGMAFALGKTVYAITGYTPPLTPTKSFANFIYELEERGNPKL